MIGNLFNIAISAIGASKNIQYLRFLGNTINDVGMQVPSYDEAITLKGSFQPLDKALYEQNGIEIHQEAFVLYTNTNLSMISEGTSSDRLFVDDEEYQVRDKNNWFRYNGWIGVTCVKL